LIRAAIVDDEPLARQNLAVLLQAHPDIEVATQCSNGIEALSALRELEVDLLFLDIQMPGLDGFGVVQQIDTPRLPIIIFVTAYDQFAVKAFELNALDYLLKPFSAERLAMSVRRARKEMNSAGGSRLEKRLEHLVNDIAPPEKAIAKFLVHDGRRTYFVSAEDVDYVKGCDYYAGLHVGGKVHLVRQTLSEIESRLDPQIFLRVHRSTIVNLRMVREFRSIGHRQHELVLQSGASIRVSRSHKAAVDAAIRREAESLRAGGPNQPATSS
jgi:two-component system, LytTR family, response regulator